MFLYWLDQSDVTEGTIIAFFQEIAQEKATNTLCFESFHFMRELVEKMVSVALSIGWLTLPGKYVQIF